LVPLQPPDAEQLVALAEVHVSVAAAPDATLVGLLLSETCGAGATVTVAFLAIVPPGPVQVRVNVVVEAIGPLDWLPLVAFAPVQPPEAVQLAAFAVDHCRVDAFPAATVVGLAINDSFGVGATATAALVETVPPAPAS